ncbi:hypothetical protein GCG54_00002742 [Colletotrichum gloeosporioides]|uniref:Uncharacterized protein n=1 Tax=Colletotrichum gloeosporioides TaxID=474922 RepID=A0A8H4CUP8_COLGL|nr:uncharacterized protein GCG54_00002742 [Colletotrichum gloeosporioides]KAF3810284.1 hypothetical protein GCG54_00002742 [Colletotrichum gloeosporioides]
MLAMTPHCRPIGNFRLLSMTDLAEYADGNSEFPMHESYWETSGINPAGQMTGITALQVQIFLFITSWDKDWTKTLDALSAVPNSIETDSELEELMYDPQLTKTKTYFKALQILRIFSDIIEEADIQVESLSPHRIPSIQGSRGQWAFQRENLVLNYNWTIVKSFHKKASTKHLTRISALKKEIESLRDGLFNAQSVKEAQKSRELNKIMMVFTIVTILFLPPSFVAVSYPIRHIEA